MIETSIVCASFKNNIWFIFFIESILKNTNLINNELILILNDVSSSIEKNILNLCGGIENIKIINNKKSNRGSYGSWNQGIAKSNGKYICIIHDDCIVTPGWLDKLVCKKGNISNDYEIISPMTNYSDEKEYVVSYDLMDGYLKHKQVNKLNIHREEIEKDIFEFYSMDINDYCALIVEDRYKITSEISTFCFLTDKSFWDKYGYFDGEFYPHKFAEKIIHYKMSLDRKFPIVYRGVYIHHNGNSTSDGCCFNLSDIIFNNQKKFVDKMSIEKNKQLNKLLKYGN